jgi:hypothetical protein
MNPSKRDDGTRMMVQPTLLSADIFKYTQMHEKGERDDRKPGQNKHRLSLPHKVEHASLKEHVEKVLRRFSSEKRIQEGLLALSSTSNTKIASHISMVHVELKPFGVDFIEPDTPIVCLSAKIYHDLSPIGHEREIYMSINTFYSMRNSSKFTIPKARLIDFRSGSLFLLNENAFT